MTHVEPERLVSLKNNDSHRNDNIAIFLNIRASLKVLACDQLVRLRPTVSQTRSGVPAAGCGGREGVPLGGCKRSVRTAGPGGGRVQVVGGPCRAPCAVFVKSDGRAIRGAERRMAYVRAAVSRGRGAWRTKSTPSDDGGGRLFQQNLTNLPGLNTWAFLPSLPARCRHRRTCRTFTRTFPPPVPGHFRIQVLS